MFRFKKNTKTKNDGLFPPAKDVAKKAEQSWPTLTCE